MLGNFFRDAIEVIVDTQFRLAMRSDVAVWLIEPADDSMRRALARLPGVTQVEERAEMEGHAVADVAGAEQALDARVHQRHALGVGALDAVGAQHRALDRHGGVGGDEALHLGGDTCGDGAALGDDGIVNGKGAHGGQAMRTAGKWQIGRYFAAPLRLRATRT